jgi:hypothetical protein
MPKETWYIAKCERRKHMPKAKKKSEELRLSIELPMKGHTGTSLRNLVNLVYARADLLTKATGGKFAVNRNLVSELQKDANTCSTMKFKNRIQEFLSKESDGIVGIEFTEAKVCFTGFPQTSNPDEIKAFTQLASMMNQSALDQKRIMAKEVKEDNEKYAFRIWLIRLGMNGDQYKTSRKVLLKNLSGHAAFRTPDQLEAAKAKHKEEGKQDETSK